MRGNFWCKMTILVAPKVMGYKGLWVVRGMGSTVLYYLIHMSLSCLGRRYLNFDPKITRKMGHDPVQ